MTFTNKKIQDFIKYIITFDNITDILDQSDRQSEKGFIFERLWDVCIKFGFCDIFPNSTFTHQIGNVNNANIKPLTTFTNYLNEKIISGNSGGCSDITLYDQLNDTYVFISSKYPKTPDDIKNKKLVSYYDIQDINSVISHNKHIYKNISVYILVPSKKSVLDKVKNANTSSEHITKFMTDEHILDKDDLNKCFLKFKQDILKNIEIYGDNINYDELYLTQKSNLSMRFHQELITRKTSNLIEEGNKSFLWGCKCRSGKTYMVGGLIIKQHEIKKKLNVLIITPAPSETTPQFTEDLFHKFKDFTNFKIHNIESSKLINGINDNLGDNNIFVMSKQLLQKYIKTEDEDNTIKVIKKINLDIIAFDENHFSGTTNLSKNILSSYSSKNTIKVYLTATYSKPLREWNISPECQMFWDIEDEQICKSILIDNTNLQKLIDKHGDEYVTKTIKYFTNLGLSIDDIFKSYQKMPELNLITTMFDSQRYDIIKENIKGSKYGFSFYALFSIKNKKSPRFEFESDVKTLLRYISGSNKEVDFKNGDKSIFTRINKHCSEKDTRIPFTQIWFLPSDNINEISVCLKSLMKEDKILGKYKVLCINRKNDKMSKAIDVKQYITDKETLAKDDGCSGLILLAGNMLSLGITLNKCDVVMLLNNTLSSDKVFQQMYRCMTEGEHKKIGFVIDLNISRVINTCINYTVFNNSRNTEDKIKYLITNNLINIDVDIMEQKNINSDVIVSKLMEIWKEDPINSFKTLLRNLDNDFVEFDTDTQKLINKHFTKSLKDVKGDLSIIVKEEDDEIQELPSGKEKVKELKEDNDDNIISEDDDKKEEQKIISFTEDILPYIIPLTCILTVKNSNMDFVKMLNDINENKELLDVFNEQCFIWWNKKDLIDLIKNIIEKYFDKSSNTYNISIQFKMSLKSLIDNPKELLELISECLKPKDIEKKQFGEVFTPMKLVNEMLDKLPKEVWTNKKLKWLDPCTGMGNFPIAVYLRLIETLKEEITDIKKRKKHILENMLYMCELNKKNVLITKQIFDLNNEFKLNIHEGDFLEFNSLNIFGVKDFDIIIGNPPYNASGTKATGNTIWQLFVKNSIKLLKSNGYICFVHPNGWRKPNTEKGKFYGLFETMTKQNTLLYLEIHDTKDGMKQFNCGTRYDWYILQKKKNENSKTKILDQNNISYDINLNKYSWLANCELELIDKLIANENEDKCKILQSMSAYEGRKKWISKTETKEFKYPVIHSTPKDKPRFMWSNRNDNGHYGIKKIIFGDSGINNPIIDIEGKYGMTQHAMAIIIDDIKEGQILSKALCSASFEKILKACLWSSFAIEWGMFKDFKKNFYELL